ncbi:MAG: DUF3048 domain-containing protein [Lachnospiraceae bacterium]|nr:DUF3048 domain-containing protein [Lachnospiraceae bacterium]
MKNKTLLSISFFLTIALVLTGCTNPWAPNSQDAESEYQPHYTLGGWNGTELQVIGDNTTDSNTGESADNSPSKNEEGPYSDPAPSAGMVRSDLTNEWIFPTEKINRPLAVMVPNNYASLPHYNLSKAGILYECNVEYEITRLMPIFDNWSELQRIGNIRSARDYFVNMAMEWDPIILHIGNIWYADEILSRSEVNNIDGNKQSNAIYRVSTERRDYDQTAYANGYQIVAAAKKLGYPLEHTGNYDFNHFSFAPKFKPTTLEDVYGNFDATKVDLSIAYPIDEPYFLYNTEDGLYYRYEYGMPHTDAATGEQLTFNNIIIQNTYYEYRQDGAYLIYRLHDTTGDGYFITNGRGIHVNWKKEGTYGTTRYFDENGDEIILNQGKTMICIVQKGDAVLMQ